MTMTQVVEIFEVEEYTKQLRRKYEKEVHTKLGRKQRKEREQRRAMKRWQQD